MMRTLAFLVVWGKNVGRSFALCHHAHARHTQVPKVCIVACKYKDDAAVAVNVKRKIQKMVLPE
jgi:hypothetical protein